MLFKPIGSGVFRGGQGGKLPRAALFLGQVNLT